MAGRLLSRRFPCKNGEHSLPRHGFTNQMSLTLESVGRGLGASFLPQRARLCCSSPELIQVVEGISQRHDTLWLFHRAQWPLSARAQCSADEAVLETFGTAGLYQLFELIRRIQ